MSIIKHEIEPLVQQIAQLIADSKKRVARFVNTELPILYWHIGNHILKFVLAGNRAAYGQQVITTVALSLTEQYGKGWTDKQLRHCLRIAETFTEADIVSATQRQLSWTHIKTISYEKNALKRTFYLEMAIAQRWNTRTLADQMDKQLYERTAIAQKPEEMIQQEIDQLKSDGLVSPDLVFKSSYVLDFLGLQHTYSEQELEDALVFHLQQFIMELGNGFAFLERQKRISIDAIDYRLDLLFFHRKLKRLVAIDLLCGTAHNKSYAA